MSSSAVCLSSLSAGTSNGFKSPFISYGLVRFLSAASYLKFPPIIFWLDSLTSSYLSGSCIIASLSCCLGLDLFLLIFPSLTPESPLLLPRSGFISIFVSLIPFFSSSKSPFLLKLLLPLTTISEWWFDYLTWPSEELDLWIGGNEGPMKFEFLALYALIFLAGESNAMDSSPTSFFPIALIRSRQNLSTSERGIALSFPNRYYKSSNCAIVDKNVRAFRMPTLYASCFLVAHSHILSS